MNTAADLGLYLRLFRGREDFFAQQGPDYYFPVAGALDEFYLGRHLDGDMTLGLYVLNTQSHCHLICIDIDIPKSELDKVAFTDHTQKHAYLKFQLDEVLKALHSQFSVPSGSILLEETGGRGYHVWVFFDGPVTGDAAVQFGAALKAHLGFDIEFFPKQGRLTPKRRYGNLIKLPLGVHQKYGARSFFCVHAGDSLRMITGTEENLCHLRSLAPMSAQSFEAFVAANLETTLPTETRAPSSFRSSHQRQQFAGDPWALISHCTAMRDLRAKAESGTRFSHSEAFHFADVLLSVPGGSDVVHDTMRHSLGTAYDQKRTQFELDRIVPLHPPSCLTLVRKGICPAYCKDTVRKRNEDPLVPSTTPCSVWLRRIPSTPTPDPADIMGAIANAENIRRSFFQLKQYHEHEDALFFDAFDFEHFESRLDANCTILATALAEQSELPFFGYMPVALPKKLNETKTLEHRGMSYSTVYDQLPIQAIFNGIAPLLESTFQPTSYGYRWNTDVASSYRIFEDWREAYPRFRNDIMAALRRHPRGYHICCDIKGYYDHIDHTTLLELVRTLVPEKYVFRMIERTISAYSFADDDALGLPQGPAYARLLANLYLNPFDAQAGNLAAAYFRYVDDFVLVFETQQEADEGLENVVRYLADLGLKLSDDEAKRAVVTPNTDVSRVRKTLDKIHYGILEGTRHVQQLAPQAVSDFMEAVERHSVSPVDFDDLTQINDVLPSLLYVVAQDTSGAHELQGKIVSIIEFLIQHGWFCPKKLKTVFYRLLDLESDEARLYRFYRAMDPVHKVYFLLSVFGSWKSRQQHGALLRRLVEAGLQEENVYVFGFSVSVAAKLGIETGPVIRREETIEKLSRQDWRFALLKWLPTVDYLDQSDDDRAAVRNVIDSSSPDLVKMLLLSQLTRLPDVYADSVYFSGLLAGCGTIVLPVACELLVAASDRGVVFNALADLIVARPSLKPIGVSLVAKRIFETRSGAGSATIGNLRSLYGYISDAELKKCMLGALSRIAEYGVECNEEFAKEHREVARYNECFLFERMGKERRYDYLELIPATRVRDHIATDLDSFRQIVEDFGAKGILPRSAVFYDSGKDEFRIEYKTDARYRVLDPADFTIDEKSVFRAVRLASEVYRKASYFRRYTGKAPYVSPDNLLVDLISGSVVFRTVGRSLCRLHLLSGAAVGDEDTDIARMLSMLLQELLFSSESECLEFVRRKPHAGTFAFLCLFVQRLKDKYPDRRYSCARFSYLVDQLRLTHEPGQARQSLDVVYLRERLKAALFRYNSEAPTWQGVCRAIDDHLSHHLRAVCSRQALNGFPYRSRLFLAGGGKGRLHTVSRQLLDFALCREDFSEAEFGNAAYFDLVEFLLLYASICLEVVALARIPSTADALTELTSSPLLSRDRVRVKAGGYDTEVFANDLAAVVMQQRRANTDEPTVGLSLRQLSLLALFACNVELGDSSITILRPTNFDDEVFRSFAHAALVRIPNVELAIEKEMQAVFLALRSNEDFDRLNCLEEMREAVDILAQDLRRVRSSLGISRRLGRADGRYFPPDVRCRSSFRRVIRVKEPTLPGCALTNSFPFSRTGYSSSWDVSDGTPVTVMIPSQGIHSLVQDLTKGKFFGLKLSYLYSGKFMALWDGVALSLSAVALALCEHTKASTTASTAVKGCCSVAAAILAVLLCAIVGKLLFIDIGHWSRRWQKAMRYIRRKFAGAGAEPPSDSANRH